MINRYKACGVVIALVSFLSASPGFATITIIVQNVQLQKSTLVQTGALDVVIESDEPIAPDLGAFQVQLSVEPAFTGVVFTGVSVPSTHPYVFDPFSPGPAGTLVGGGSGVLEGDILFGASAPLDDGDSLGRIEFEVTGGTQPGGFDVVVSTNPLETFLFDDANQNLPYSTRNGTITIVPEPNICASFIGGFVILVAWARVKNSAF